MDVDARAPGTSRVAGGERQHELAKARGLPDGRGRRDSRHHSVRLCAVPSARTVRRACLTAIATAGRVLEGHGASARLQPLAENASVLMTATPSERTGNSPVPPPSISSRTPARRGLRLPALPRFPARSVRAPRLPGARVRVHDEPRAPPDDTGERRRNQRGDALGRSAIRSALQRHPSAHRHLVGRAP